MQVRSNLSGIYFRTLNKETDKYENICFEELPEEEQERILCQKDKPWVMDLVKHLCATINYLGKTFQHYGPINK